jgi:hypothetical protein
MAANNIIYLPNQPIQMYLVNPTATEIEEGYTSWATTAYHKRQGDCYFYGLDYCTPVNKATDKLQFQFKAKTTGANLVLPLFNPYLSGTNTSVSAGKLVDSGNPFGAVDLNQLVINTTNNTGTYVSNVDSASTLSMEQDIFTATPRNYSIYSIIVNGGFRYFPATDLFTVSTAGGGYYVEYTGVLTIGNWYKITINVTDITAGSLDINVGGVVCATITSVGEHTVYGQADSTDTFLVQASNTFVGSYDGLSLDVRELVTDYWIILFDKDTELYYDSIPWSESSDSLTIGNIFVNTTWAADILNPACGSYVIGVTDQEICEGNIVQNGNMSSSTGWALDTNASITGGYLVFQGVATNDGAENTLNCTIKNGLEYTVQWDITNRSGIQNGSYVLQTAQGNISPSYSAASQGTATISFTFTATADSSTISFIVSSANATFRIDNFIVTATADAIITEMDGLSECLCVCVNECTALIEYGSTRPTFGSFFDGTVNMQYRIPGRVRNTGFNDLELNPFKSSLDSEVQPYNNLNSVSELATQPMPEYAHNILGVALSHPTVKINGVGFKRIGAYAPNWQDDELAEVIVNIAKRNQANLRNNY